MRIVLDLQGAQTASRYRGIGRYSVALAQAVVRQAGRHDVWVAVNGGFGETLPDVRAAFESLLPSTRIVTFDTPDGTAWEDPSHRWRRDVAERMRESFLNDLRPDAVHVSSLFEGTTDRAVTSIGLLPSTARTGVTLYDLIPLHNPVEYLGNGWARDWYMSKVESLKRSDVFLAISEHARQEAIDTLGFEPERVVNISAAVSSEFRPRPVGDAERAVLNRDHGIRGPYLMYSGAMDKRKNVEGLLEAFASLTAEMRGRYQLVIAGKVHDADLERMRQASSRFGLDDRVVFTGYVDNERLVLLYNAAELYVFPSLHEGFGLPALEAMACGVPTIGSNTTSVPEVIGRSDAMFDPASVREMASSMARALGDADFRDSLRAHALSHSAKFSWDTSAKRLLDAFEASVDGGSSTNRGWSTVAGEMEVNYRSLISAVASIPRIEGEGSEEDRIAIAAAIASNQDEALHAARTEEPLGDDICWRLEGPFDSSYSLALVNREVALALQGDGVQVGLHSTEGPGDFDPDMSYLAARPDIESMYRRGSTMPPAAADISSRNLYPPRVADMASRFNVLHDYAWEESGFPSSWVDQFNDSLQGILTLSKHVSKILIDNGVSVPVATGLCGIDHWERIVAEPTYAVEGKSFRFLHVSSCFPRKGVDVMLKAFGDMFTASDDVTLVIKTFPNPHNEVHQWLRDAQAGRSDFPDVRIIEEDMPDEKLKALYAGCHALVAPSRAEGFGLPLAEAMVSGLPVITTAWGGQTDFCRPDTAWLVDYDFVEAKTHFGLFHSVWAEPRQADLGRAMHEVWAAEPAVRQAQVRNAQVLLRDHFKWSDLSATLLDFVRGLSRRSRVRSPKVAWISTWNKRCGIASYSGHLVDHMPSRDVTVFATIAGERTALDGGNVVRCWESEAPDNLFDLSAALAQHGGDVVVIQFQYGFFEFQPLSRLIHEQKRAGKVVVVMMHATQDPPHAPSRKLAMLVPALSECDRLLVHGIADLNRLKDHGLVDNVAIIPHGIPSFEGVPVGERASSRFRIASYGFCLPHKGLPQLLDAVERLVRKGRDVELLMLNAEYPVGESADLIRDLAARIAEQGLSERVSLVTEYLTDEDSFQRLSSVDLIVFPYQGTGESSSAAVRYGLAVGCPVAVTPISIFDDVGGAVHRFPGTSPEEIAEGLDAIVQGRVDAEGVAATANKWREAHRYTALGRRLYNMLSSMHANGGLGMSTSRNTVSHVVSTVPTRKN